MWTLPPLAPGKTNNNNKKSIILFQAGRQRYMLTKARIRHWEWVQLAHSKCTQQLLRTAVSSVPQNNPSHQSQQYQTRMRAAEHSASHWAGCTTQNHPNKCKHKRCRSNPQYEVFKHFKNASLANRSILAAHSPSTFHCSSRSVSAPWPVCPGLLKYSNTSTGQTEQTLTDSCNVLQCVELKARPPSTHQWIISPTVPPHCHVLTFPKLLDQTVSIPVFDLFLLIKPYQFVGPTLAVPVPVKHQ